MNSLVNQLNAKDRIPQILDPSLPSAPVPVGVVENLSLSTIRESEV